MKTKKKAPFETAFDQVRKIQVVQDVFLWLSTIIAIILAVYPNLPFHSGLTAINCLLISFYVLTDFIASYLLLKAEEKRKLDFIDSSLGSNFSGIKSKNYFTNDNLDPGIYKMATNCFHSCLFTSSAANKMILPILIKNLAIIIIFLLAATQGRTEIIILMFQLSLPIVLVYKLVKLFIFASNTNLILQNFKDLFNDLKSSGGPESKSAAMLRAVIHYESNISWASILLSKSKYAHDNAKLEKQWEKLKREYDID